ncbi:glycoside hydrolase family 53 protein [Actinoplanes subtropicus]|uniref:glycoside hydrolase family 53 protein n=1 Tax=Actinoplanes subtropicus TaxID=543632 RepID=UPI00068B95C2|nr:glycosyl hydrolase 53 family protein [Actinoplanes subtropicus]
MPSALSRRGFLAGAGGIALSTLVPAQAFAAAKPSTALATGPSTASAAKPPAALGIRGADLSFLPQLEEAGVKYTDPAGHVRPAEEILARQGANFMRMRVWVDPPAGYSDKARALALARRAKRAGLKILLDPHYSDFWADPGKQYPPASWPTDLASLKVKIKTYTRSLVREFAAQGTPVDIIQIGNEITNGLLWPAGQLYLPDGTQQWEAFTDLLKAGTEGALEGCGGHRPRTMLHIDKGGLMGDTRWFFDNVSAHGVPFDIIGQSYYPMWHGSIADLEANLNDSVSRYGKPVLLAEVSYPWTFEDGDGRGNIVGPGTYLPDADRFPATPAGQAAFYEAVRDVLAQVPDGKGLGFMVWEPEWIPGVGWEPGAEASNDNLTQFDFTGHALPSLRAYRRP